MGQLSRTSSLYKRSALTLHDLSPPFCLRTEQNHLCIQRLCRYYKDCINAWEFSPEPTDSSLVNLVSSAHIQLEREVSKEWG